MPLTPEDIVTRQFGEARRGYDPDEVDAFLEAVAVDYRRLAHLLRVARAELDEERGRSSPGQDPVDGVGQRIQDVLRSAVTAAETIRSDALRAAAETRESAGREAAETKAAALRTAVEIETAAEQEAERLGVLALQAAETVRAEAEAAAAVLRDQALRHVDMAVRTREEDQAEAETESLKVSPQAP